MSHWLNKVYFGNTTHDWVVALGSTLGLAFISWLFLHLSAPRLKARADRTGALADLALADLLAGVRLPVLLALALAAGAQSLDLPARPTRLLDLLPSFALIYQGAVWGFWAIRTWLDRQFRGPGPKDGSSTTRAAVIGFVLRLVLVSLVLLTVLEVLGFNVTTLLASLGIGGVAVALAIQNILGDLFASLSIAMDKPFIIGDFIMVDNILGSVEYIGVRSTRIHSLPGEQIVFSNGDLLKSRIHNFMKMPERRVLFNFTLPYRTARAKAAALPGAVRRIIEDQPLTRFDRAHLFAFTDLGLQYEVVYYIQGSDYNLYMDIQQAINLALWDALEQEGLGFAVPARRIFTQMETG